MSAPLSTKALSLLSHIKEGKIETAKAIVMSKLMYGYSTRRQVQEATGLTSGSVTARINELVKAGLVVVEPHKARDDKTGKCVSNYGRSAEVMLWENKICRS